MRARGIGVEGVAGWGDGQWGSLEGGVRERDRDLCLRGREISIGSGCPGGIEGGEEGARVEECEGLPPGAKERVILRVERGEKMYSERGRCGEREQ